MYYTVDTDKERSAGERPVAVEFVVRPDNPKNGASAKSSESPKRTDGEARRFTLCDGGEWLRNLQGDVTMPAQEDPPVNSLFLALRGSGDNEAFLDELAEAAARAGQPDSRQNRMELRVTTRDGRELTVPVRSVQRGANSLSFYRQSAHQAL